MWFTEVDDPNQAAIATIGTGLEGTIGSWGAPSPTPTPTPEPVPIGPNFTG